MSLDLGFYESPQFYDHLYRARSDASTRPLALLESSGGLLQNTITLVAMAAVLIPYGLWLPPAPAQKSPTRARHHDRQRRKLGSGV